LASTLNSSAQRPGHLQWPGTGPEEGRYLDSQSMSADRAELTESRRRYLRAVLSATGLKTMAALAKRLRVTQSTLTNIQNGSRSASPDLIAKIRHLAPGVEGAAILGAQAIAQLREPAEPSRIWLGERLAQVQRERVQELQGLDEEQGKNSREVAGNFDAMDRDDVFVYLSATRRPLEMDPDETELKISIARAMLRHAYFVYIRPAKAYLKAVGDFVDIRAEFEAFKIRVLSIISAHRETVSTPATSLGKQLLLVQADEHPLFVAPDFNWELFYSKRIDVPHKAIAGALIATSHGDHLAQARKGGPNIRIFLSVMATKRVLFEVAKTLCALNPTLDETDRLPDDIIRGLKDSAEQATGEKIERRAVD
jgi:transcriptional regulator with XRE-family HTH domain